jgi:hypothetical protein
MAGIPGQSGCAGKDFLAHGIPVLRQPDEMTFAIVPAPKPAAFTAWSP